MPRDGDGAIVNSSFRPGRILSGVLARAAVAGARIRGDAADGCVVLNYHSVGDPVEQGIYPGNAVPAPVFRRQVAFLARHARCLSLSDMEEHVAGEKPFPPRSVLVTFDDGYRGVHDVAFPILREHGVPAVVFVPTDAVASGEEKWEDRLARCLYRSAESRLSVDTGDADPWELPLATREDRCRAVLAVCRRKPWSGRISPSEWTDTFIRGHGGPGASHRSVLSPSEMATMVAGGLLRFGSHSATHAVMADLDRRRFADELERSKRAVEGWTGQPCRSFAFPYGDAVTIPSFASEELRSAGFALAFSTIEGYVRPGDDPFRLRRTLVHPGDSLPVFELKVRGAYADFERRHARVRSLFT